MRLNGQSFSPFLYLCTRLYREVGLRNFMKTRVKILLLLAALGRPFSAVAWQLSGIITGSLNQPVPYVSVFIKNTTHGVATNLKGQYFLELSNGSYALVVQTIGYLKKEVPFTIDGTNKKLNITLIQNVTALDEINISADREDPAYPIIRKAIANRKKFRTGRRALNPYCLPMKLERSSRKRLIFYPKRKKWCSYCGM